MDWLQNNWIWIALAVGFLALHRFGRGGHGGGCGHHSGHDRHVASSSPSEGRSSEVDASIERAIAPQEHAHSGATISVLPNSNPAVTGPSRTKPHRHGC